MTDKTKNKLTKKTNTDKLYPIILDFGTIASLFFNEHGVEELLNTRILHIVGAKTMNRKKADLIFGIELVNDDTFELRCVITTPYGTEYLNIYDDIIDIEYFNIKRWMHICTCDSIRKHQLIKKCPDNYVFNDNLLLA